MPDVGGNKCQRLSSETRGSVWRLGVSQELCDYVTWRVARDVVGVDPMYNKVAKRRRGRLQGSGTLEDFAFHQYLSIALINQSLPDLSNEQASTSTTTHETKDLRNKTLNGDQPGRLSSSI